MRGSLSIRVVRVRWRVICLGRLTAHGEGVNGRVVAWVTGWSNQPPEVSVLTQLFLATSPEVVEKGIRGRYFVNVARESEGQLNRLVGREGL